MPAEDYAGLAAKCEAMRTAMRKACSRLDEVDQEGDGMEDASETGRSRAIAYARTTLRAAIKEDKTA